MNPYSELPSSAFWKTGVTQENPYAINNIYKKKFDIKPNTQIATAGSCFGQHVGNHLRRNGYQVIDEEIAPPGLPDELHQKYGFSLYSARYGNIYTVRQLLQLAQEVAGERKPENYIWKKNGKYFDALRPAVEPEGLDSEQEVIDHRDFHIEKVKDVFTKMDLFIFTLGLTEMWVHKESGTVYPTAPGTICGEFDEDIYEFKNAQFLEIIHDFKTFQETVKKIRSYKPFQILLTVSPVPLTATASGKHVLVSTSFSKSILRAVAGQLSTNQRHIDYFPSFEIVNNPRLHSKTFEDNLRSVRDETVQMVMNHFFKEHKKLNDEENYKSSDPHSMGIQCEEAILESLQNETKSQVKNVNYQKYPDYIEIVGNSHSSSFLAYLRKLDDFEEISQKIIYAPNISLIKKNVLGRKYSVPITEKEFDLSQKLNPFQRKIKKILPRKIIGNRDYLIGFGGILGSEGINRYFGRPTGNDLTTTPKIPIINNEDNIDKLVIQKFLNDLNQFKAKFQELKSVTKNFWWIGSPPFPQNTAIKRFGEKFVESRSQKIINQIFKKYVNQVLHDFIYDGNIIFFPEKFLTEEGFLDERFNRNTQNILEIHASADCYEEIFDEIKRNCPYL